MFNRFHSRFSLERFGSLGSYERTAEYIQSVGGSISRDKFSESPKMGRIERVIPAINNFTIYPTAAKCYFK